MNRTRLLIPFLATLALAACGNKGPLVQATAPVDAVPAPATTAPVEEPLETAPVAPAPGSELPATEPTPAAEPATQPEAMPAPPAGGTNG